MKHYDVYKMLVTVKGSVIYKILLEEGDSENDIAKETIKTVIEEYNCSGGLINWDTAPDIIKGETENEFYVFEGIHFSHEVYVSVGEDEDLYVKSIEKFREEVPSIQNIKEMAVDLLELMEDPEDRVSQSIDLVEKFFAKKGEDEND